MLESTSKFTVKEVIYDKDGFALATGFWDGATGLSLACRWHDAKSLGYPQTFGKPQWMLLPDDVEVRCENLLAPNKKQISIVFPRAHLAAEKNAVE
jgi:hypothetical protein